LHFTAIHLFYTLIPYTARAAGYNFASSKKIMNYKKIKKKDKKQAIQFILRLNEICSFAPPLE
jgi:hypothetical protein